MTREEAIKIIREIEYPVNGDNKKERDEAIDMAIEALKQKPCGDAISRQWLMECVNEGWIKFDTEKDKNTFVHLVRDIAPPVTPEPQPCSNAIDILTEPKQ